MDGPLKILCVDDEDDIRAIVAMSLQLDPQIDVRTAGSGDEAMRMLLDDEWQPGCILLDARMPGVNGRMVLADIRTIPRHADTPVIFLTAGVTPGDTSSYLALSARGVIAKPFDPARLAQQVRDLL